MRVFVCGGFPVRIGGRRGPVRHTRPCPVNPPISLCTAKYHLSRSRRPFPNLFARYRVTKGPPSSVVKPPRIGQFIHDNTREISLQAAVAFALANSVYIAA